MTYRDPYPEATQRAREMWARWGIDWAQKWAKEEPDTMTTYEKDEPVDEPLPAPTPIEGDRPLPLPEEDSTEDED